MRRVARHLSRLFAEHVGSTPAQVAQTRRVLLAHRLLLDTALPIADVAFAAGFGSVRQFNDVFRRDVGATPTALRRTRRNTRNGHDAPASAGAPLRLHIPVRQPWNAKPLAAFLTARALPGVEQVAGGVYERRIPSGSVRIDLAADPVVVDLATTDLAVLPAVLGSVRSLLDADADTATIEAHVTERVPALAGVFGAQAGLRVPGPWDPWETTVRVVLGQQISVAAAATLAGRLVGEDGTFPDAPTLATSDLVDDLGMPAARKRALRALATAVASGSVSLAGPIADARGALSTLPGIGPWTVEVIAMRALRDPDAFPATDLGVRRALASHQLEGGAAAVAEAVRPWRSYLTMHLWETIR